MSEFDSEELHMGFTSALLGNIIPSTESFINYFQQAVRRFKYHRVPCCASDTINLIPQLVKRWHFLNVSVCLSAFDNLGARAATHLTPYIWKVEDDKLVMNHYF